jgi:hypothetical protein
MNFGDKNKTEDDTLEEEKICNLLIFLHNSKKTKKCTFSFFLLFSENLIESASAVPPSARVSGGPRVLIADIGETPSALQRKYYKTNYGLYLPIL